MKQRTQYSCQSCGYNTSKWLGRCPGCEVWNSFIEERTGGTSAQEFRTTRDDVLEAVGVHGALVTGGAVEWYPLDEEEVEETDGSSKKKAPKFLKRLTTGMSELDRVLGGGMVPDSFILIGGDPGIGKSTLLLQMAKGIREKQSDLRLLYVSGEESIDQIRGRAHRLGVVGGGRVFLASETQLERVFATVKELKPNVLVMDSLQTFSSGFLQSAPGSVSQLREVAARLMALAKSAGIAVWLVGHVTKEGSIAGPKVVEHMVDTVLYFEAEGGQSYRLLRTVKNRFGSTNELGVFEMDGEGLREVSNPSSLFLSDRKESVPGTAVGASMEGSRPILIELQALVASSALGTPRRTSVGMDSARVSLLAAILEKHMKVSLAEDDLFFNVAGGLRLTEPACDLAAAAAIWSSAEDHSIPLGWAFMGELSLTGEVRRVTSSDIRIEEAKKLGFRTMVVPKSTPKQILDRYGKVSDGIKLIQIGRVDELPRLFS